MAALSWPTVAAWDGISEERVHRSFLKCGISNAMDGTKDDILRQEINNSDNYNSHTEADYCHDALTNDQAVITCE